MTEVRARLEKAASGERRAKTMGSTGLTLIIGPAKRCALRWKQHRLANPGNARQPRPAHAPRPPPASPLTQSHASQHGHGHEDRACLPPDVVRQIFHNVQQLTSRRCGVDHRCARRAAPTETVHRRGFRGKMCGGPRRNGATRGERRGVGRPSPPARGLLSRRGYRKKWSLYGVPLGSCSFQKGTPAGRPAGDMSEPAKCQRARPSCEIRARQRQGLLRYLFRNATHARMHAHRIFFSFCQLGLGRMIDRSVRILPLYSAV
jgi:hypothetical protein